MKTPRQTAALGLALALALAASGAADAADDEVEAQRLAFSALPGYDAYGLTSGEIAVSRRARAAWNRGETQDAVSMLQAWLTTYPLSLTGHRMLTEFCRALASRAASSEERDRLDAESKAHFAQYAGLIRSIAHGTGCASVEDHCRVINIAEENAILIDSGGRAKLRQAVARPQGVPYDIVVARTASGDERTYYFEISAFYKGP